MSVSAPETPTISITDACRHPDLFRPYFEAVANKLAKRERSTQPLKPFATFKKWLVILKAIYGTPITSDFGRQVIQDVTGRDAALLPEEGFSTVLILAGRRSGKSTMSAIMGAHAALLSGSAARLSPGEVGLVACISSTRNQARNVAGPLRAVFDLCPSLKAQVATATQSSYLLKNGVRLETLPSDYRSVRGFSLLAVFCDELAHFGIEGASKTRTDSMVFEALQPALASAEGKFVGITTPYGKQGLCYRLFKEHFGKNQSDVLVINAPSKYLNPSLSDAYLERHKRYDLSSYLCEYEAQFQDSVSAYIPIEVIQNLVVKGRYENMPMPGNRYVAFADLSGGRSDCSVLAITSRKKDGKIVLDHLGIFPPPHSPFHVIAQMAEKLKEFSVKSVVGDAFGGEFCTQAFRAQNVRYSKSDKSKSQIYADALAVLTSGNVELLDTRCRLEREFSQLERRTRSGGRDSIDKPNLRHAHDDACNATCGAICLASRPLLRAGAAGF